MSDLQMIVARPSRGSSLLLSRYAECLFWLARYMERVENLARVLDVTDTFVRHGADQSGWVSVIQINSDEKRFAELHGTVTAEAVLRFYLTDTKNPTSIAASLFAARENARTLRPLISTEMWAQINMFYNRVRLMTAGRRPPLPRIANLRVSEGGVPGACRHTEGTFFRDQGWPFYCIGKYLERGDQTSRLLDIKYHTLLPSARDVGGAQDVNQWHALLRAASGYHAFRRVYSERHDAGRRCRLSHAEPLLPALDRTERAPDRNLSQPARRRLRAASRQLGA